MTDHTPEEERAARIIDPPAWNGLDAEPEFREPWTRRCAPSLEKARAILAPHQALMRELLGTAEAINGSLDYTEELLRPWEDPPPEPPIFAKVRAALDGPSGERQPGQDARAGQGR
jgi:hypothetical protein